MVSFAWLGVLAFPTMDAAAADALAKAYVCSEHRRECGGVIYSWVEPSTSKTWYFYSPAETSDKPFGVDITALTAPPPGRMALVADYHVHICSIHNKLFAEFFSYADASVNDGFHTVGYILDSCTGNIHRYAPGDDDRDDEEVDFVSGKKIYLTIGHISGWLDLRRI